MSDQPSNVASHGRVLGNLDALARASGAVRKAAQDAAKQIADERAAKASSASQEGPR